MDVRHKNIAGGIGLALLVLAGSAYAAWTYWPKPIHHHPALGIDISNYDGDQIIGFVRGLGDLSKIPSEDRVAIFNKLKARFDNMSLQDQAKIMNAAREAMEDNKLDPIVVNGRELMKAYQHVMLTEYFKADAAGRQKIMDERIKEQQKAEAARNMAQALGIFKAKSDNPQDRLAMMRPYISDAIKDAMLNGTPEDRAMMTQFMMEMRAERVKRGLPVAF